MDEIQTAWLAGLYEGEGCLHRRRTNGTGYELTIAMADGDVVHRAHAITGLGRVQHIPAYHEGWSEKWAWRVGKREEIATVMRAIRPLLGHRRGADADDFLAWVDAGAPSWSTPELRARKAAAMRNWRART